MRELRMDGDQWAACTGLSLRPARSVPYLRVQGFQRSEVCGKLQPNQEGVAYYVA